MSKQKKTSPDLSLCVQYAVAEPRLPRWRLRRWILQAVQGAHRLPGFSPTRLQLVLRLVGRAEARQLNQHFRGKDYATNVLTFDYGRQPDGSVCADLVICVPVLASEAREQRKPFIWHAAHLVVHGTLHALGFDHIKARDANRMEALETDVLAGMGIADPYVIRDPLLQSDRLS